ncbi:MAG: hypothetical protein WC730_00940 [Patescibacteria group bacterium]|jgi:hypothetical protein
MRKLIVFTGILLLFPGFAFAQISTDSTGLTETGEVIYGSLDSSDATQDIGSFVGARIISPLLGILGVIFLVLTIYAGVIWMTAGGEKTHVKKAQDILVNSVIGLLIVIAAYALTQFVLTMLTS